MAPRMTHMCVIVESNVIIRAVARFVAYSMDVRQVSFYDTEAEAIDARDGSDASRELTADGILQHLAETAPGAAGSRTTTWPPRRPTSVANCWLACSRCTRT